MHYVLYAVNGFCNLVLYMFLLVPCTVDLFRLLLFMRKLNNAHKHTRLYSNFILPTWAMSFYQKKLVQLYKTAEAQERLLLEQQIIGVDLLTGDLFFSTRIYVLRKKESIDLYLMAK